MSFETLQASHPWPATRPEVPDDIQGWFQDAHKVFLEKAIKKHSPKVIVELGTWKGRSAEWFLSHPEVRLICVDLWDPPKTYVATNRELIQEQNVYEKAIRNLWRFRDRCVLIQLPTTHGLEEIHRHAIQPDLIYVDAGHEYPDVSADIVKCREIFPWAKLVGDDFQHPPVARAVKEAAGREAMKVEQGGRYCWGLVEHGTRDPATYQEEYGGLPVAGKVVFDWGADWGSTARWFLGRGAAAVIASEKKESDNVRMSRYAEIESRIKQEGFICTPGHLSRIVASCEVAKVDVEGDEIVLMELANEVLQKVTHWVIETHSKRIDALLKEKFNQAGFSWNLVRAFASNPEVRVVSAVLPCR